MSQNVDVVYDESPIELPTDLPFYANDTNKTLIRAAFKAAGITPRWPLSTREVHTVLRIIGYDANRQRQDYCLARGYLKSPPKERKAFVWNEADVVAFADALESIRAWLPMHPCHAHKYSDSELAQARIEAARKQAALQAFAEMHPNELVNMLVATEEKDTRELIAYVLKSQLGVIHLRGNEQVATVLPAEVN